MGRAPVGVEAGHAERGTLLSSWASAVAAAEAAGLRVGVISAVATFPMRQRGVVAEVVHLAVVLPDGRWVDATGSRTERQALDAHPAWPGRRQAVQLVAPADARRLVAAVLRRDREVDGCGAGEPVGADRQAPVIGVTGEGRGTDGSRVAALRA